MLTHLLLDGWWPHISYKKTIGFIYRILRRICRLCANLNCLSDCCVFALVNNITVLFTYRIGRMQSRASRSKEHPSTVYNILDTVISLSYMCYHNVLWDLNLNCLRHTIFHLPLVVTLGNWEGLHKPNSLGSLFM